MLESCFTHLPGIGPSTQGKLAAAGIRSWDDALRLPLPMSEAKASIFRAGVEESRRRLEACDLRWFTQTLRPAEHWRLFPYGREQAAYVDIETNGLSHENCYITTIALYDGKSVRTYVQGENLDAFADDILQYSLLVTWNGRCFDAPILRRLLRIPLDAPHTGHMAHIDLLPVFRAMHLRGGLKKVESALGIARDDLDGVDGWAAVRLWRAYEQTTDRRYLDTLLAYNVADVLGLERLAEYAVVRLGSEKGVCDEEGQGRSPTLTEMGIKPARQECNPHRADAFVLDWLRTQYVYSSEE